MGKRSKASDQTQPGTALHWGGVGGQAVAVSLSNDERGLREGRVELREAHRQRERDKMSEGRRTCYDPRDSQTGGGNLG